MDRPKKDRDDEVVLLLVYFFRKGSIFFGLSYDDLSFYTVGEIKELLSQGKIVDQKIINKRKKGVIVIHETGQKTRLFYGQIVKEIQKAAYKAKNAERMILKGVPASRGNGKLVRGMARIILNPQKDKFQKGEILVTSMTRVEFVPLMRQAKAIITDEGGIACHAAIVSREMKKPCIIGTKIVTKILKDGDLVEVDVNKGIVKILQSNSR